MLYLTMILTLSLLCREAELIRIRPLSPSLCSAETFQMECGLGENYISPKYDGTIFSMRAFPSFSLNPPSNECTHRAVPYVLCLGMAVSLSHNQ